MYVNGCFPRAPEDARLPPRRYRQVQALLDPFYHTYRCGDGRPFYVVCPCHAIHQRRCLEALGVYGEMRAAGLPEGDVYADSAAWRAASQ